MLQVDLRVIQAGTGNMENTPEIENEDIECTACRVMHSSERLSIDKLEFDPFVQYSIVPPMSSGMEFIQL